MSDKEKKAYERIEARLDRLEESLERIERHVVDQTPAARDAHPGDDTAGALDSGSTDEVGEKKGTPQEASDEEFGSSTKERSTDEDRSGGVESDDTAEQRMPGRLDVEFDVETWLNRLGIALLLIGLVFLYRLSEEMGLLTDPVRVGLGIGLGAGLFGVGWRVREQRRRLSQILFGGSIAAFYISVYAGYELYGIFAHVVAFGAMCGVTMIAFLLAHRWREVSLSVIGAVGGFATPFALSSGEGNILGLSVYNGLLVSGMTAIYIDRGWKHLLALTAIGGWLVVVLATALHVDSGPELATTAVVTGCIIVVWTAVGMAPAVRRAVVQKTRFPTSHLVSLAVVSAVLATLLVRALWDLSSMTWVGIYGLVAAVYAGGAHLLARRLDGGVVGVHRLLGFGFSVLAWIQLLEGAMLAAALAVWMGGVQYAARHLDDPGLRGAGHVMAVALTGWLVIIHFEWMTDEPTYWLGPEAVAVVAVVVGLLASSRVLEWKATRVAYRYLVHGAVMAFVFAQATPRSYGDYLASGLWAGYASAVLVGGLLLGSKHVQRVGLATIVVTVGKLLVFDMHQAETIWRVGVFVGIGALLLLISYLSPSLRGVASSSESDFDAGQ